MKNPTRSFVFTQIERLKIVSGTKTSIFTYATSHNAPYLPTKILHNLCFSFLLGITAVPREIENNAYSEFWRANKVHYGKCRSGVRDELNE